MVMVEEYSLLHTFTYIYVMPMKRYGMRCIYLEKSPGYYAQRQECLTFSKTSIDK